MKLNTFMKELATGAGGILMKHFNKTHRIEHKRNAGIVTEADKGAEAFLLKNIFRKYPNSSIITEESGEFRRGSELCWVLDPLDGTTNYASGLPWFCVSIGLMEEGELKAGVIYNPISKELFEGEIGKGAKLNGKRIRVSKEKRIGDSVIGTGFYYSKGETLRQEMEIFTRVNEYARGVRRPGSAALDLCFVAAGRYDGFWEKRLSPWDVAAGFVIVQEAGGVISNYKGKPTDIHEGEVIASNGGIHRKMVSIISQ